jgi:hypothetical protein
VIFIFTVISVARTAFYSETEKKLSAAYAPPELIVVNSIS